MLTFIWDMINGKFEFLNIYFHSLGSGQLKRFAEDSVVLAKLEEYLCRKFGLDIV